MLGQAPGAHRGQQPSLVNSFTPSSGMSLMELAGGARSPPWGRMGCEWVTVAHPILLPRFTWCPWVVTHPSSRMWQLLG